MKFSNTAAFLFAVSSATNAFAFSPSSSFVTKPFAKNTQNSNNLLTMNYSVGIVGATGAVGKEIVGCLNKSDLAVSKLRVFGSKRSAGTTKDLGKFGSVEVELFDEEKARECDVIFLAVSGDFALEHAKNISEGEDGAVVIDNSVSRIHFLSAKKLIRLKSCVKSYLSKKIIGCLMKLLRVNLSLNCDYKSL